jgi:pimeloyl-ACP methyl ester carboxylesterase
MRICAFLAVIMTLVTSVGLSQARSASPGPSGVKTEVGANSVSWQAQAGEEISGVKTEIGTMDGAAYRIDIPRDWNRRLVVYYHGYREEPITFKQGPPTEFDNALLAHGYALIQSGYSITGWALAKAYPETEALREYFISKYGKPAETFVEGESMGGLLTAMTIEQEPEYYNGAFAMCGPLNPTDAFLQHLFAMRAALDYYFPGVLPALDPVPRNYRVTQTLAREAERALQANPAGAAAMRSLLRLQSNEDVANNMLFFTYAIMDAQEKAGGNPFDNRNYIYEGTSDDRALNAGVKRYAADPEATQFLVQYYTPTGRLLRPMLALTTTYDTLVDPSRVYAYEFAVERQGRAQNFVQQYVNADGHCVFTPGQVWGAFSELVNWVNKEQRPAPGLLPENSH